MGRGKELGFSEVSKELDALCATFGISERINKRTSNQIQKKAEEIMCKAYEEFEKYLDSKGLEQVMGMICPKN